MKYVSLSFDDGPCSDSPDTTSDMLDILQKHNVAASFFVIGNKINDSNIPVLKRALSMGCDIQNHSFTHPFMTKLTEEQIKTEFNKCEALIKGIAGTASQFFRPPYIDVNDLMYKNIDRTFICGVGCNDWDNNYDAEYRLNSMKESAADGVIYLLHTMEGNDYTLKAVDQLIPYLKEQGYTFVTVPQMFALKNIKPEHHKLWSIVE